MLINMMDGNKYGGCRMGILSGLQKKITTMLNLLVEWKERK